MATLGSARAVSASREVGTLEAGKRADVLVLDGDPLADLSALQRIHADICVRASRPPRCDEAAKKSRTPGDRDELRPSDLRFPSHVTRRPGPEEAGACAISATRAESLGSTASGWPSISCGRRSSTTCPSSRH
jgi:hypothetical protein